MEADQARQPSLKELIVSTVKALEALGGEGTNAQIAAKVIEIESILTNSQNVSRGSAQFTPTRSLPQSARRSSKENRETD